MKKIALVGAMLSTFIVNQAIAEPADYVNTPDVTYAEKEIDFKFGTVKAGDEDRSNAASLGFGYGVTQTWFTEFYAKYKREDGNGTTFDAFEWENKFQLTEPGQYPVDFGFLTELERPQNRDEGYEVKIGPLFQTEFGKTQLNGNLFFTRNYRAADTFLDAGTNGVRMSYQWQVKYRLMPIFEFGVQGFGEVGQWNHWAPRDEQSHRIGPAIFGRIALGAGRGVRYNAAILTDMGDAVHNNTFRTQIEYEY